MKPIFLITTCLVALVASSCATYSDPIDALPLGKTVSGSVELRDMWLPLPDGEWEIVGRGYSKDGNYVQLCLEKNFGNKPHAVIVIMRDSISNNYEKGYKSAKMLERKNILHVVSNRNTTGKPIDGWYINHSRLSMGQFKDRPDAIKQAYQRILDKKFVVPGNFITTVHCLSGKNYNMSKFLRYEINVNPELEGFAPPKNPEWGSSDWHIARINADPKKVEYIEGLKEKGAAFHAKLKAVFGE